MPIPRVLTIVLAGGAGSRLQPLTDRRAKAAVPFAGVYRLIDFPLSNCQHSHLSDVWVSVQFHPVSLADHLSNGRPWDLDRTSGGLMHLHPYRGDDRGGWHAGTADLLWRYAPLVREFAPDALVVLSADAVYTLNYRDVVEAHLSERAGVTMVTTEVDKDAGRYGVVQSQGDVISRYDLKPDDPEGRTIASEVFVFEPGLLLDRLEDLADDQEGESAEGGDTEGKSSGLGDLGHRILPDLVKGGRARAWRLDSYWRDVGKLDAYWAANMDFLAGAPPIDFEDPAWPIHTKGGRHAAARILPGADIDNSIVSGGCRVAGDVSRSVLGPSVVVEPGASVEDSIILSRAVIRRGAHVTRAVVEEAAVLQSGRHGGEDIVVLGDPPPPRLSAR